MSERPQGAGNGIEFDKRKGFRRGMPVRFSGSTSGTGTVESLYHASAAISADDGRRVVVKYVDMMRI